MPTDTMNASSSQLDGAPDGAPPATGGNQGNIRPDNSGSSTTPQETTSDNVLAAQATNQAAAGNSSGAKATIQQIQDSSKRIAVHNRIFGTGARSQQPPAGLFQAGTSGISDPNALFFMMVFYLKDASPNFSWTDVLNTAKAYAPNNSFGNIKPNDAFLPQRTSLLTDVATAVTGVKGSPAPNNSTGDANAQAKAQTTAQFQANRDAETAAKGTSVGGTGGSSRGGGASPTVVWPVQCMPVIEGGLSKSVDWPSNQAPTLAEPTVAFNKGAGPIEIDVEFTYAVGIYGIGDAEPGVTSDGDASSLPQPPDSTGKWWSVEEVMGMIYLATSLVYPFQSTPVVSSPTTPPANGSFGQFPVLFLRHYSLFPYLTPFVVKQVKIVPDEGQPLIVTEPLNLKLGIDNDLVYPAVRQVVKITLTLMSAHYYLPIFAGQDQGNQIQTRTSGSTYLQLAKTLLQKRVP